MNESRPSGIAPEEAEQTRQVQPVTPAEAPRSPEDQQQVRQERRHWWNFWGRGERTRGDIDFNRENDIQPAIPESEAINTPEQLVDRIDQMDAVRWRESQMDQKYGGGLMGRFKSFLAGERDFTMDENGNIRRNGFNELARKALITVFNKKTMLAAGTLAVVGAFTGGVGIPAASAMFGTMVGRGAAEAWHSFNGRERGLREEMARSQYRQWCRLHASAMECGEEGITDIERNQRLHGLVEQFYATNNEVIARERAVLAEEQRWNKI